MSMCNQCWTAWICSGGKTEVPLKLFQRLLGHMATTATVKPLGLLHMRPLQHWLYGRLPRWAWYCGTLRIVITPGCCCLFSPWLDHAVQWAGVQSNRCVPLIFRESSIVQLMHSHDSLPSLENGDSILRWFSSFGVDSGKPRWACSLPESLLTAGYFIPLPRPPLGTDRLAHSWPWGLCKYSFPPSCRLGGEVCYCGR